MIIALPRLGTSTIVNISNSLKIEQAMLRNISANLYSVWFNRNIHFTSNNNRWVSKAF